MPNVKFQQFNKKQVSYKKMSIDMAKEAERVCMMLSVAILADVFDFEDDEVEEFMQAYKALADSLGIGQDDIDTIKKNIQERFEVKL